MTDTETAEKSAGSSDASILARAKRDAEKAKNGWSEIYQKAKEDLEFLSDEPDAQWDKEEYKARKGTGRPVISVDQASQFVHQVVNDIRMNTPTINCIPHTGGADVETAEIFDGLIKDIEYQSGADEAYDTAADFAVKSSLGFILIDHEFADKETFNQELRIKRVVNPEAILIDDESIEIDGSDSKFGFIFDPITVEAFKTNWPDKTPCSFWDEPGVKSYADKDSIIIAQYFWIEEERRKLTAPEVGATAQEARTREAVKKRVRRCKLSGNGVLEHGDDFPGEYVPIVPVYGKEAWEGGVRKLHSLIRKARSPAFMFNLWKSLETEVLMKQPMAPVQAATGQTENYAEDYKNPTKAAVLRYDPVDVDGNLLPAPSRLMPPSFPAGFSQASRGSLEDMKGSMGMYNASLGQRSNETSGVAIARRQTEGDVATYHFGDNLVKSITHVGRILVSAIPVIYDNARILRTIDKEENPKMVGVNGAKAPKQERSFDLSQGSYTVRVITGPAFTTQRQEAAAVLSDLMAKQPDLAKIAGDILFKNMDFPGAQAVAERIKKTISPELLDEQDGEQAPDPEKLQMQQVIEQGQQMLQRMQQQLTELQQQVKVKDLQAQFQKAQSDIKSSTDNLSSQEQIASLKLENQEKELKITQLQIEKQLRESAEKAAIGGMGPMQ